jgi:hypothetical protein
MSKIETQLEVNGVTYSGKDLDLIGLGMSLKEESIIKFLEAFDTCYCAEDDPNPKHYRCGTNQGLIPQEIIALIKGEK